MRKIAAFLFTITILASGFDLEASDKPDSRPKAKNKAKTNNKVKDPETPDQCLQNHLQDEWIHPQQLVRAGV